MKTQQFLTIAVTRMTPVTLGRGVQWACAGLVAVWGVSTAGARPAAAQVFNGNVTLTTQTDVDNFAYTEVTGDLIVQDDGSDPITNLDGLSSLTSVGHALRVFDNSSLTDVDGLSSLTSVERFLFVVDNPSLVDVDGLSNVTQGGPALGIGVFGNDSLTNVDGLIGLTFVGEDLNVFDNASLTNVDGLRNITSVGRILRVAGNPLLTDVDGLSNITAVSTGGAGFMHIGNNDSLTEVDGLSSLTSVGGGVGLTANDLLTDLDGLINLTSVEGDLNISFNPSLIDVDGLNSLTSVGGPLNILSNVSLTEFCGLYPLLAGGGLGGGYDVSNNAANPTIQQILDAGPCNPADTIMDLLAEGAINEGMATALQHLANNSLEGLAGSLMGFVQSGILSPLEAQLLFVIASNQP